MTTRNPINDLIDAFNAANDARDVDAAWAALRGIASWDADLAAQILTNYVGPPETGQPSI